MNIGFLRSKSAKDELEAEMAALEKVGCERIVVDGGPPSKQNGMLSTVIGRLSNGDSLTVWNFEAVAGSLREFIDVVLELDARNVRFRSLSEAFDTHGRQRSAIKTTLVQLQEFKRQLVERRESEAAQKLERRVGRPRILSSSDIEHARTLAREGTPLNEVAKQFNVSKATLARYLLEDGH